MFSKSHCFEIHELNITEGPSQTTCTANSYDLDPHKFRAHHEGGRSPCLLVVPAGKIHVLNDHVLSEDMLYQIPNQQGDQNNRPEGLDTTRFFEEQIVYDQRIF